MGNTIYAVVVVITKLTSKYSLKNPWLFNFLYNGSILLFTIPVALLNHVSVPTKWEDIIWAEFFFAASSLFYIMSTFLLDISVLSPLFNFRTAFAVILAFFILHETLTPFQYLLIGVIFIAGLFATIDEKLSLTSFFTKGTFVGMLCMISLAFLGIFTNRAITQSGFWNATLWIMIVSQLFLLPTIPFFMKAIKKLGKTPLLILSGIGILETIAAIAMNGAFAVNVGITSAIVSVPLSMLMAIAISFIAPSFLEKHTTTVYLIRLSAAVVMILAALHL